MKTSILTLLAAALLCTACVNELTPDFSDMEGELTINAFLFTDRDTNYVYVSETSRRKPVWNRRSHMREESQIRKDRKRFLTKYEVH